jgi:hypothetical protein
MDVYLRELRVENCGVLLEEMPMVRCIPLLGLKYMLRIKTLGSGLWLC